MGKGTSTSTQTQSSSLAPYNPASTGLDGILGSLTKMAPGAASLNPTQSGAINKVISNSNATPDYSAPIASGTLGLLNGGNANANNPAISGNLADYKGLLDATASGSNIGKNPALKAQLDQIASDTTNSVNGSWAAAGRDGSPGNAMALGRGIAAGQAPVIAAQYNTDVANQRSAADALYGAGNTTYGILNANNANSNQNFTNGVGTVSAGVNANNAAPTAAINAAAQEFGIPVSQLTTLLGAISPVAAQFGQQSGKSEGTQDLSTIQQFGILANGLGSLWPKGNISFGA